MKIHPDDAGKKLQREVKAYAAQEAARAAQTEIAEQGDDPNETVFATNIRDEQKRLSRTVASLDAAHRSERDRLNRVISESDARHAAEQHRLQYEINDLESRIRIAFPGADLVGHHAEHLGAKEDRDFWKRMRMTTGLAAFWVGIISILVAAFSGRR